jgi:hypothetical protein
MFFYILILKVFRKAMLFGSLAPWNGMSLSLGWRRWPPYMEGSLRICGISSCGHLTRGGPLALGVGQGANNFSL